MFDDNLEFDVIERLRLARFAWPPSGSSTAWRSLHNELARARAGNQRWWLEQLRQTLEEWLQFVDRQLADLGSEAVPSTVEIEEDLEDDQREWRGIEFGRPELRAPFPGLRAAARGRWRRF